MELGDQEQCAESEWACEDNFIDMIKSHYEQLSDKNTVSMLWQQLTKKETQSCYEDKLAEYRSHLPTDLYRYLKLLGLKFSELSKENLQLLDGSHKTYLITFLYYCTRKDGTVIDRAKSVATTLYLQLTLLPEFGKLFFNDSMYMWQMSAAYTVIRSPEVDNENKKILIKLIKRHCLLHEHLDKALLAASANVIITSMMLGISKEMIHTETVTGLSACCMKALRLIMLHTSSHILIRTISLKLFRCTRRKFLDRLPNGELAVETIILFLKGTLKIRAFDRKIEPILTGFTDNWASDEFTQFKDAVKIMNVFSEEYYKDLLRKISTLTEPNRPKTLLINVFNIIREILTTPPKFPFAKISVLYSCTISNVLHHVLHSAEEVVVTAIDILKEICDARTNPLHKNIFAEVRSTRKLVNKPIESVILGLSQAANPNWTIRNKKLFKIVLHFILVTPYLNPDIADKTFNGIIKDATPRSFDMLDIVQTAFLAVSERGEEKIAEILLKIINRFASHTTDKYCMLYTHHIFYGMLRPSHVNGKTYPQKYYYRIYLTPSFNYEALFNRCQSLIGEQEVNMAIKNLDCKEPGSGILLCCLLEHCPYSNTNTLVPYIINNFHDLSGHLTAGYVCTALEKILECQRVSDLIHPQLNAIQSGILLGLAEKNFPIQSIKAVYSLYQKIQTILNLSEKDEELDAVLDLMGKSVLRKLNDIELDDSSAVLYLNEVCLVTNRTPNNAFITVLQSCLDNPIKVTEIQFFMGDIYAEILTLLCTIAMVDRRKVNIPVKYLEENFSNVNGILKVISMKLLYSMCKEITHEYDNVIKFAFKEIVTGNPSLVKMCVIILEELVHEDYIMLSAEEFFKLVYPLAYSELKEFVKSTLLKRFMLSNQNDIMKYYMQSIMYANLYGKSPNYPIFSEFYEELAIIKSKMDTKRFMFQFLFIQLSMQKRFNILMEIAELFENLVKGRCKVDESFFEVLLDLIATIKCMKTSLNDKLNTKHYYHNVVKQVEKQIIRFDTNYSSSQYHKEFENEIKRLTLAMLKLLFFENETLVAKIQLPLFDSLMHWIDLVKPEIIDYIHQDRGTDYGPYFAKLVQFYKKHKSTLDHVSR